MRRVFLYTCFAFAFLITATAAGSTCVVQQWELTLDYLNPRPLGMSVDADGNTYVLLTNGVNVDQPLDLRLVKYDASARLIWETPEEAIGSESYQAFAIDHAGNAYVALSGSSGELVTAKYSATGTRLWVTRFAAGPSRRFLGMQVAADDGDGGVFVLAETEYAGQWTDQIVLVKYAQHGDQLWSVTQRGGMHVSDAAVTPDSGVVVALGAQIEGVTHKFAADGTLLWTVRGGFRVLVDASGATYLPSYDGVRKYGADGGLLWAAPFVGPVQDLELDSEGNLYVMGTPWNPQRSGYVTSKYGPGGELLWSATYVPVEGRFARPVGLAVDAHGNVYVSGDTYTADMSMYRQLATAVMAKYDSDGVERWTAKYEEPSGRYTGPRDVAVDPAGDAYLLVELADRAVIVKYVQPGGP